MLGGSAMTPPATATPDAPATSPIGVPPVRPDQRLIQSITPRNLLSFGPDTAPLPLENLNVLVGPNGSGKSNLLDAISLLRGAASDMRPVILRGDGIGEWIWKGAPNDAASLTAIIANPGLPPLRHCLVLRAEQQRFRLDDERIELDFDKTSKVALFCL